ncbi:MAG: hypothetical protein F2799_07500 [Actinobacteria bacterium]|uniref:non-specific serine/threonine protein kinase n=1 Tax=freshwater metagenome TaxID=449393 RepID=A0A6J7EQJ3_9ZZZZ|nr:hypothetical protein [Actinomycetota bacterium]
MPSARTTVRAAGLCFAIALTCAPAASAFQTPQVSAGSNQSCGVSATGVGVCWGGRDGDAALPAGHKWKQLSAGNGRSCGVTTTGAGYCWGVDAYGVLNVPTGKRWKSIDAGGYLNVCGITTTGAGYCWGTVPGDPNLTAVPSGKKWRTLSSGWKQACGVTTAGQGMCWGDMTHDTTAVPAHKTWKMIKSAYQSTCGVTTSGEGLCWGFPGGSVPTGKVWSSIDMNGIGQCGVTTTGEGLCWGRGDGETSKLAIPWSSGWVSIDVGLSHSCGITTSGRALCWGLDTDRGDDGQANVPAGLPDVRFSTDPALLHMPATTSRFSRTSPTQRIAIRNNAPTALSELFLSPTPVLSQDGGGAFRITAETCFASWFHPQASCIVTVKFTPKRGQRGTVNGLLSVTSVYAHPVVRRGHVACLARATTPAHPAGCGEPDPGPTYTVRLKASAAVVKKSHFTG